LFASFVGPPAGVTRGEKGRKEREEGSGKEKKRGRNRPGYFSVSPGKREGGGERKTLGGGGRMYLTTAFRLSRHTNTEEEGKKKKKRKGLEKREEKVAVPHMSYPYFSSNWGKEKGGERGGNGGEKKKERGRYVRQIWSH